MLKEKLFRLGGVVTATGILLAALPVQAAELTGKDIKDCDYYFEIGKTITPADDGYLSFSLDELGIPATDKISSIWLNVTSPDAEKTCMPAIGYVAEGYNENDWYMDGVAFTQTDATLVFEIPEEAPVAPEFQVQLWAWEGTVESYTLNSLGLKTGSSQGIGMMTRKGDVNGDKTVNTADVVELAKYLSGKTAELAMPANGDLDKSGKLNAIDLTLLKRGLINGEFDVVATDETAMEFVSHIKMGWNLGNTLDATVTSYSGPTSAETAWGCPFTTKAMIDLVKQSGFNCVRVPVTWGEKCSGSDYKIDDAWMNRVQEVVDYVMDNDMYCILNIHHDNEKRANGAYFYPDQSNLEHSKDFVSKVWTQIADRFEGYSNKLIFEVLNEPRLVGTSDEWNGGNAEARAIVNQIEEAGYKAIRATGGNNEKRFVMFPAYAANSGYTALADLKLPADDHVIVDIHGYAPYGFALDINGTNQWDEGSGGRDIISIFDTAKNLFLSKGIPVIIGETGAMNKNNEDVRAAWAKFYFGTAAQYGIPCVWWDNNCFNTNGENFGLINRGSLSVQYPKVMAAMVEATKDRG